MAGRVNQKQHERFLLEQFLSVAQLPAHIVGEREAPDFLVLFENRRIGVEVTEIFISHESSHSTLQVQESISSRIVRRARELYRASKAPPAYVTVCFGPGQDLRRLHMSETAAALARYVQSLKLTEGQRVDWRPEDDDDRLPDEISFVHALGSPSQSVGHWSVTRAGWVAPITAEALTARINEKAKRLADYQVVVPENWLIIVADATKPSQLFEVRFDLESAAIASPFSRTFFYCHPDRVTVELGSRTL